MPDNRFYKSVGPFSVIELAQISGAKIANEHCRKILIKDVAAIESAGPEEISFLDNPRYVEAFSKSSAGVCVVHPDRAKKAPDGMILLLSEAPYLAFAKIATKMYPDLDIKSVQKEKPIVHRSATVGANTDIAPGVFVGADAEIGANCVLGPNSVIGNGVILGDDCRVGPSVSIQYAIIGSGVRLFAGVRVGEPGFGFATSEHGHFTVPQLGRVIIGNYSEIGANSTIDRGSTNDTVIGKGCRIDNLVQIGHNVVLGEGCIIVAQVGISGSTRLGDYVVVGGQVGIAGHLKIGNGAQIAAQSGVMNDLAPGEKYGGSPAVPMRQWINQAAMLRSMGRKKVKKDG